MALAIEQQELKPGVFLLRLSGRIMLGSESAQVEAAVDQLIAGGGRHIVFDLSGATHIDSTGIGCFISCLNKIRRAGGSLRLAAAGGQVREAFRITRLDTIFSFFDDTKAALQDMNI